MELDKKLNVNKNKDEKNKETEGTVFTDDDFKKFAKSYFNQK